MILLLKFIVALGILYYFYYAGELMFTFGGEQVLITNDSYG